MNLIATPKLGFFCCAFIEKQKRIYGIIVSNLYSAWQFTSFFVGEV